MKITRILVIDDDITIADKLAAFLRKKSYHTEATNDPKKGIKMALDQPYDLCICDFMMPGITGIEVMESIKEKHPETEMIMISAFGDMDTVIQAMRKGATDFVKKPFSLAEIQLAIERTSKYLEIQSELSDSKNEASLITRQLEQMIDQECIGESTSMKNIVELALKIAHDRDASVLISGENGTGKEVIARLIHYASERKNKQFYPVNTAAIPETLLESEIFGHKKGSFTDAHEDRKGCFELANGGTLFLDEISEMPFSLQVKLLRALEEKKFRPIGSDKEISVDVRIISATNKDINLLVKEEKFRVDLYHRINTINIRIPPLRERTDDIEPLLNHFIKYFSRRKNLPIPSIDKDILPELMKYDFPGNVRELKNMVERALIISNGTRLELSDFMLSQNGIPPLHPENKSYNLEETEKMLIRLVLKESAYIQVKAAEMLGISRDALKRKLKKYGIAVEKKLS